MSTITQTPPKMWWDDQPEAVRAVIDLAYARSEMTPSVHDRVLAAFAPQHAESIREIADELGWAERLRTDEPAEVLAAYYGCRVTALSPLDEADRAADECEASALTTAQLVASLMQVPAGAR